ncbi:hypothetical protein DF185_05330 [Marinifilum breve]|uniref:Uncharacterized protein n=1 Tax=Marinifilum breve TaxID=2184082 RepID=A0A2V4A2H1_9BACT|nr:hypothetical protein DF185_05330 [Marinifilum breve]
MLLKANHSSASLRVNLFLVLSASRREHTKDRKGVCIMKHYFIKKKLKDMELIGVQKKAISIN